MVSFSILFLIFYLKVCYLRLELKNNFLKKVRDLAYKNNIVLIFDEITSGFHNNFGGLHLTLDINPDICIFAKAMANGYPISAILGKSTIMDFAQETFISSTMWTERIGFVAALATLKKMDSHKVQDRLVYYGQMLKKMIKAVWLHPKMQFLMGQI